MSSCPCTRKSDRSRSPPCNAAQTTSVCAGDSGRGLYRVGTLLGHHGARTGLGFADYTRPSDLPVDLPGTRPGSARSYRGVPGQLTWWTDTHLHPYWSDAWIAGTEDPCLLHLRP